MSVSTPDHEPTLFDPKPAADRARDRLAAEATSAATDAVNEAAPAGSEEAAATVVEAEAAEEQPSADEPAQAASEPDPGAPPAQADVDSPQVDRKRLAEQLDALRRKEAELLRALAVSDHPQLADAIRSIEARVYCVSRAQAKLAQGLSKSEARRQEVIAKKLTALRDKRVELDAQIEALEGEHKELGASRLLEFQRERQDALRDLMVALATHDAAIHAAGLDVQALLPEVGALMPELEAIARSVSGPRAQS